MEAITCRKYLYIRGWLVSTKLTDLTTASIGTALKIIVWMVMVGKDIKEGAFAIASIFKAMTADHLT